MTAEHDEAVDAIDHEEPLGALVLGAALMVLIVGMWAWAYILLLARA